MTCLCDFPDCCDGLGVLLCDGCGGDQCVCTCGGEMACPGCIDCGFGDPDAETEFQDGLK